MNSDFATTKYHGQLIEQSRLFKNFWMKDEVDPAHLFEDRIRFTQHGMHVFEKSAKKYPKPDFRKTVPVDQGGRPLDTLFSDYGVPQSRKDKESGLKSLSDLLLKSNERLKRAEAKTRKVVSR